MIEKTLSTKLADCLDWMEKTGAKPQEAASRHPGESRELLNLLQTAARLKAAKKPAPSAEFRSVSRTRLLNQIEAAEKASVTNGRASRHKRRRTQQSGTQPAFQTQHKRRFAMTWMLVIGLIASLLIGGGSAAYASNNALPGDALYPVKTTLQEFELVFSSDVRDVELLMEHLSLNITEMHQLALQGRDEDILTGLEEYVQNLQALAHVRSRVSYEDAGADESLNLRLQEQLHTHAQLLEELQLQLQSRNQLHLMEKIQEAIQLTENGNTYGPNEGELPGDSGGQNGVGPGEPQGTQTQKEESQQEGSGSSSCEEADSNDDCVTGEGQHNGEPGSQDNAGEDGQGPRDGNGGSGKGPGGKP